MTYDLSGLNYTTDWLQVMTTINTSSNNWLATIFLYAVWGVSYMMMRKEENLIEFAVSSFITSVIAILLLLAGLLTWPVTILPIIGLIVSLGLMFFL